MQVGCGENLRKQNSLLAHHPSRCDVSAGRPPCAETVSMNAAAAATATAVLEDCHSRQHAKHRSNLQVRAEEALSYPRIPYNPRTHPTVTAIEFG